MLMADDASNLWAFGEEPAAAVDGDDANGDLCFDLDELCEMLGENSEFLENTREDLPPSNIPQAPLNIDVGASSKAEFSGSFAPSPSYHSVTSDSRIGISATSSDSAGNSMIFGSVKPESSLNQGSPVNSFSVSLHDWIPGDFQGQFYPDSNDVCRNAGTCLEHIEETQCGNGTGMFCFESGESNHVNDSIETIDSSHVKVETEFQLRHWATHSEYLSPNSLMTEDNSNVVMVSHGDDYCLPEMDGSACDSSHARANSSEIQDVFSGGGNQSSCMCLMSKEASLGQCASPNCDFESSNDNNGRSLEAIDLDACHHDGSDISRNRLPFAIPSNNFNDQSFPSEKKMIENIFTYEDRAPQFYETVDGVSSMKASSTAEELPARGFIRKMDHLVSLKQGKDYVSHETRRSYQHLDIFGQTALDEPGSVAHDRCLDVDGAEYLISSPAVSNKKFGCPKIKRESSPYLAKNMSYFSKNAQVIQSLSEAKRYSTDNDGDVCILEDLSDPAHPSLSINDAKSVVPRQSNFSRPLSSMSVGHVRPKTNAERVVFRAVLQDLSQPKSEDSPPDGVLAVPLLRHQRIALSWMAKKEKYGSVCTGGILADDQGLGKTVSTIALILKERSPSAADSTTMKQRDAETVNLDEDDNDDSSASSQANTSFMNNGNTAIQSRGRLAAGTLIVCPTSVLRQWFDELHNKVTSQANVSVLVYHGSGRTKDPSELAKYDVVLTTYSIVSMEMPKQPLVEEEDDDIRKRGCEISMELSSSKKRKYPPSSSKRPAKGKKGMDSELLESIASPLAKVGWFRVVLDEAQSIKNHRTQVARACWGLRAKRRWCLSGTPIQNAVDDLYSYFRFLRIEAYFKYKSFCSEIKGPIQKNPADGYRKLQAFLKTIMLRRTKGTRLDGQPIINLPPKTIELRKVDFTEEERDFYCRLEADSRAQFAEYAAAGTVKQNYVNILLMLLRLRQACDHPHLVRGYNSKTVERSSVETAKKLPREKQNFLLGCLQGSQAICGLCSDPPEDAVVTVCGHVFCNQCIFEHLTGDDRQCPFTACKVLLNASSIFSIETLRSSLSDQPGLESTSNGSESEVAEASDPFASGYDSSKIRAALQVLQSLPRPQICVLSGTLTVKDEAASSGKLPDSRMVGSDTDKNENNDSDFPGYSSAMARVDGEKAIVFSQWTRMLDLLEACLKDSSIQYRRLDGTMSIAARDKAVKDFNTLPEVSVMIMSLKAASLGLNMVAACHVLLLDLWWNPTTEDQAIDRAHRIGQTRPVTVVRLTVKDTVEDRILALQQKKREMVASAFGEDETGSRQTRLTVEDLEYLFGQNNRL